MDEIEYDLGFEDQRWLTFAAEMQNNGFRLLLKERHVDDPAQIFDLVEIPISDQGSFPVDIFMGICRQYGWKVHAETYEALFYEQILSFYYKEDFEMILDKQQKTLSFLRL